MPPSTLSMSISFFTSMADKAAETGVAFNTLNEVARLNLLQEVLEEYNTHGVVAVNEKYQLKTRGQIAVTNLILYVAPEALIEMQAILNTCKEANSPFSRDILESRRHLRGMTAASLHSSASQTIWHTIMTITDPKQVRFLKRVKTEHAKNMKFAASATALKHWSLDAWNEECNYSCWLEWGIEETKAKQEVVDGVQRCVLDEKSLQNVTELGLLGEFKDHFETAWVAKDPNYGVEDLPWFPEKAKTNQSLMNPFSNEQHATLSQAFPKILEVQNAAAMWRAIGSYLLLVTKGVGRPMCADTQAGVRHDPVRVLI